MKISTSIEIVAPKEVVWAAITNIEEAANMITGIIALEVLNSPQEGFVGLKWKETRKMFGKEAVETMWITDAVENEYYCTRAESHGCLYISRLSLTETGNSTTLTMTFSGEAETFLGKILSSCMSYFIKNSMKKELDKDLNDIKAHVEHS